MSGWSYRILPESVVFMRGTLIVEVAACDLYTFGRMVEGAAFEWHRVTGKPLDYKCAADWAEGKDK